MRYLLFHKCVLSWKPAGFLALLNFKAEEVVGRPLTEFVAPEYAELVASNLKRRLAGEWPGSRRGCGS